MFSSPTLDEYPSFQHIEYASFDDVDSFVFQARQEAFNDRVESSAWIHEEYAQVEYQPGMPSTAMQAAHRGEQVNASAEELSPLAPSVLPQSSSSSDSSMSLFGNQDSSSTSASTPDPYSSVTIQVIEIRSHSPAPAPVPLPRIRRFSIASLLARRSSRNNENANGEANRRRNRSRSFGALRPALMRRNA